MLHQHAAKRLIGKDAGEVVHAAVAFGLSDHGDDLIGGELPRLDPLLHAACIGYGFQLDFRDFNGHQVASPVNICTDDASRAPGRDDLVGFNALVPLDKIRSSPIFVF